jgi:hypothetical protein
VTERLHQANESESIWHYFGARDERNHHADKDAPKPEHDHAQVHENLFSMLETDLKASDLLGIHPLESVLEEGA